jgi:hypothetical protein
MMSRKSRSANVEARSLFQRAIEIDARAFHVLIESEGIPL